MGAACCVAARDKTIQSGSNSEIMHRNIRCSPTWSFRWDHRGRVAGEDISINWSSDGISGNDGLENKNGSSYVSVSEDGSPSQNYQMNRRQKSPISEGTTSHVINSTSDQSISRNVSVDVRMEQAKASAESSTVLFHSPAKPSRILPSTSCSSSSQSSQCHLPTSSSTPLRCPSHSPGHKLLRQVSDNPMLGFKSPSSFCTSSERPVFPSWSNGLSQGGPSDGWSMPGFSEMMGTSYNERWSLDSESFGYNPERLDRSSSRSADPSNLHTCGVCSKPLSEKSSWSTQKIIASNDLSVVSVLVCGHIYHAECLESMTLEINKFDPACPVCTFGQKQTIKLSEKALKAEKDLKARNKRSKNQIVDNDIDEDFIVFDQFKDRGRQGKGPRMESSSSGRNSFGKPFLRKHFSFGSKGSKAFIDNHPTRKKGFFWAKSSKE